MEKINRKIKGKIIINPFLIPAQSVGQAKRLKEEFALLSVETEIITDGFLRSGVFDGKTFSSLADADFIVYLDKDKYLSDILERCGVRLFNRHTAIRVCDDKAETCIFLANHGIKIPKTVFGALCYSREKTIPDCYADKIASEIGFPVIVKESYGSMGKGVYKTNDRQELLVLIEKVKTKPHLFQEYIGFNSGVDTRIIVVGGKAVACMERRNLDDFRSNIAVGGKGVAVMPPVNFIKTAERCADIIGLDYCGVDLLTDACGEPVVCEVNSNAFFEGIEAVTGVNVAKSYAEHILRTLSK